MSCNCEKHAKEYNLDKSLAQNKTSVCSCSKCNSFECFALRNKENCLCYQGSEPQPCLYVSSDDLTNRCQSQSSLKNCKLPDTECVLRERVKQEITYDTNNTTNVATVNEYFKNSYNCVPTLSNQGYTENDKMKKSTETLSHIITVPPYSTFTSSRQNVDTNTAKLSAQIMDVPYENFKESISHDKSVISTLKLTKLSRLDIIRRIKEACKVCSCKVCECLIGKALTNQISEFCKCKPCECNECGTLMNRIDNNGKIKEMNLKCQYASCDRENERKSAIKIERPGYCNCEPCECLKCIDSYNIPCDCQPCECIECKSNSVTKPRRNNTLIVASMREDVPRASCQCSPCQCDESVQSYSMATSLRHEMGTGMSRQVNCSCETCVNLSCETDDSNSCTCDVQKRLMRKPVQKDTQDYGIHRASIINNVTKEKSKNKNDTIAMIDSLETSFPKFKTKNHSSSYGGCECIVCSFKENDANLIQEKSLKCHNLRACKCSTCKCVMCNSSNKGADFLDIKNICKCNTCDCIKCDGLPKPPTANYDSHPKSTNFKVRPPDACKCRPSECTECQKMMYKCTRDSCCCTNNKYQMSMNPTKFIDETVYHNRNNDLALPCLYNNNINGEYFVKNKYGRTSLTPNPLQSDRGQMISRGNISIYNNYISVEGLKGNPKRKSTQAFIPNNSETIERKRNQTTSASEPYTQCKENKFVQFYRGASEYESSRSLSLMEPFSKSISELSRNSEFTLQDHEEANVKDLSYNLVAYLKKANERLSILMNPKLPCYYPKLEHSKTDISVPRKKDNRKEVIGNNEFNVPLQNYCSKCPENLSDLEIDKVKSTLQQAKCFSLELTKVLNEYRKIDHKLACNKFLRETSMNLYNDSLFDIKHSSHLPDNDSAKVALDVHDEINIIKRKGSYKFCHGSISIGEPNDSLFDIKHSSHLPDNDSAKVTHDVDDEINIIKRQGSYKFCHGSISIGEPSSSKYNHHQSDNHQVEDPLEKVKESYQTNKDIDKCRYSKNLKNIRKGSNILRVPKTVKGFKLNKALIKVASNATNIRLRQDNFVPLSIHCKKIGRVNIADETTPYEPNIVEDKHETTSTATEAVGRNETSGLVEAAQDANWLKNLSFSILKKNCLMNSPYYSQNRRLSLLPPLLMEMKDTVRNISRRQYSEPERSEQHNEVTVAGHASRALLQLQTEVNQLWQSSMSQSSDKRESKPGSPIGRSKLEMNVKDFKIASAQTCNVTNSVERGVNCTINTVSLDILQSQVRELLKKMLFLKHPDVKKSLKINESKCSSITTKNSCKCESERNTIKVKFLSLRRVSVHTVLVKWKAPQDINSVQGYELLVDGRAVQKILSPSRCMAVVTCLPHIEKVIITIRTLVSTSTNRHHSPVATIVYNTRAK